MSILLSAVCLKSHHARCVRHSGKCVYVTSEIWCGAILLIVSLNLPVGRPSDFLDSCLLFAYGRWTLCEPWFTTRWGSLDSYERLLIGWMWKWPQFLTLGDTSELKFEWFQDQIVADICTAIQVQNRVHENNCAIAPLVTSTNFTPSLLSDKR